MSGGKVWVVTGASRGIGAAIARVAVDAGHRVALIARGDSVLSAAEGLGDAAKGSAAQTALEALRAREALAMRTSVLPPSPPAAATSSTSPAPTPATSATTSAPKLQTNRLSCQCTTPTPKDCKCKPIRQKSWVQRRVLPFHGKSPVPS